MSTIPADSIVNVVPSVLAAGGTGTTGIGLILSHNSRLPIGAVQNFPDEQAVSTFFGPSDPLVGEAAFYFDGFVGASILPSSLLMAQFNQVPVAAYLRGGNVSGLTLPQLQAISGSLDITIDGVAHNASAINLSSATSFSNAASTIQSGINGSLATLASGTGVIAAETATITGSISGYVLNVTAVTGTVYPGSTLSGTGVTSGTLVGNQISGTPGGIGTYAVSIAQTVTSESITSSYGQLTVSGSVTGAFAVGQLLSGTGVQANTLITALISGTGGDGTYVVNNNTAVGSTTISSTGADAVVSYDSVSGAFVVTSGNTGAVSTIAFATGSIAASLELTSATGATLSQGANVSTPAAFMTALLTQNSAWANFMTHFDPDAGSGNVEKQAFAAWKNTARGGNKYAYFCWDPDASPAASDDASSSLGQILKANGDSGTLLLWEGTNATGDDTGLCAFALGLAASINYAAVNGRTDFAFRQGANLTANVTDPTTAANLLANGYCFYGAYGSANAPYIWLQNGQITGPFAWADSYQTQIWLNSFFQTALLTLFETALSVPFTVAGIALIEQTLQTVIAQADSFGAFAPNTLTSGQIAEVNNAAGASIAGALQSNGYYLQINLPSQVVQAARGPWPMTFWYIDRNSVQSIDLSSVLVQ